MVSAVTARPKGSLWPALAGCPVLGVDLAGVFNSAITDIDSGPETGSRWGDDKAYAFEAPTR